MVSRHEQIHDIVVHAIYESIFLGDASRPEVRTQMTERLGLSKSREGIPQRRLDQVEQPERRFPVRLDPIAKVLETFRLHR